MATVTKQLAYVDGGAFILQFDYDDGTLRIQAFRGINTGTRSYSVTATSTSTGDSLTRVCPAGQTTTQNINPGAQNRYQLSVTTGGKLDGVEWSIV
jgi:hypothetical protein